MNEDFEIWRDVVSYDGVFSEAYQVNTNGDVWSKDRHIIDKNGMRKLLKGQKLTPNEVAGGYLQVLLRYNENNKPILVHRIIASCFPEICGEWFPGAEIDHLNGNPSDNRPENLRWCTHTENINNPITVVRRSKSLKSALNNPEVKHKMSVAQIKNRQNLSKEVVQLTNDCTFIKEYQSCTEAARLTGGNKGNISNCCRGVSKSAGGYRWMFKDDYEKLREAV